MTMFQRALQGRMWRCNSKTTLQFVRGISSTGINASSAETRNIGIMAHIDAGKTTTTERMLFYSGFINRMGDIDAGNTVMDYLESERSRGITVQSAAISFKWNKSMINLIDTPGHVDFTIEVERSLRVLDGAVAVFDSSRGVEAQTRTVWRQAEQNKVPCIAFLNKMDKDGSNFVESVKSIQDQLNVKTIILQLPLFANDQFCGVIDTINLETIEWNMEKQTNNIGRPFSRNIMNSSHSRWNECMKARENVIEQLAELYDEVADTWLDGPLAGDVASFPADQMTTWIRRATIGNHVVPVLCGTSLKNIGVQPLLDAVVNYLPSPCDISHNFIKFYEGRLVAMAFKIIHDRKYGVLVFVRVYSGKLKNKSQIFNANKCSSETVSQLLAVYADEYREVSEVGAGSIGVVCALKRTMTGDTLIESEEVYNEACLKADANDKVSRGSSSAVLATVPIPEPVFFRSIFADSMKFEEPLEKALSIISREDPSVHVKPQYHGGFLLCGMGELHLDIVADRIRQEFKVKVLLGEVQVAYREMPTLSCNAEETVEKTIMGTSYVVFVRVRVQPANEYRSFSDLHSIGEVAHGPPHVVHAAALGVHQECQRGSMYGFPIIGARVELVQAKAKKGCPVALITSIASQCTRKALEESECQLIEPITNIEVTTTSTQLQPILTELTKCHATIRNISERNQMTLITAEAALTEIKDFASSLRSATSGRADLHIQISGYQQVSPEREHKIKSKISGGSFLS